MINALTLDGLFRGFPARIIRADPEDAQMNMALRFFGDEVTALQVLWPDPEGRFPGEPGFTLTQPTFPV
ncbi:DUF4262 domain-containing protein [Nocardioides sp. HDW12B]|uniref:DUF4262 domain-containing protein n=1 Tax=Nocardioides sp. HDW12B TaxID=2714939 RepID=UPI00140BF9CB|nr:DUF4262 domain-containing protein [Nocardioides sp. HDW12B]QIK66540.1 DUF4262 domain-containing protein [Nocardioides sp. HDW12B]